MSIGSSLPSLDFRTLISENERAIAIIEKDFETHHTIFATSIADSLAKMILKQLGEDFKKPYYRSPSESKPDLYYAYFRFDTPYKNNKNGLYPTVHDGSSDYDNWKKQFSKGLNLTGNSNAYARELMERVAVLTERKFIE